jgi:hypothetical protein
MAEDATPELSETERARIREEMRYAIAVLKESKPAEIPKSPLEKFLGYLSNGFVLLLIGSLITSLLVPRFQRQYENRKQQVSLMQECFSQFLLYTNSLWQEYYLLFPPIHQSDINRDTYNQYIKEISEIKLKRYDAFSKVEASAIVFRKDAFKQTSNVEVALTDYAVRVNMISAEIDTWLRNLYCAPTKCVSSVRSPVNPEFSPYDSFVNLQDLMRGIQEDARKVSELMVSQIQMPK